MTFGIDDASVGSPRPGDASDARTCFSCGEPLVYRHAYVGHLGDWRCSACDAARPTPDIRAREIRARGLDGTQFELATPDGATTIELGVGGLYNVYNALGAATAASDLGVDLGRVATSLADARAAFGRQERLNVNGHPVRILLGKNPTGLNEALRTLQGRNAPLHLLVLLNDGLADGTDVSWIWDTDWEALAPRVKSLIVGGSRAADIGLRLEYAGLPAPLSAQPDVGRALGEALAALPDGAELTVLPTYTALLDVRARLGKLAGAPPIWEGA